jgi:hypothetical protein
MDVLLNLVVSSLILVVGCLRDRVGASVALVGFAGFHGDPELHTSNAPVS